MIWTTFSTLLFFGLSVMASYSIGGFAYFAPMLVAIVICIKIVQSRESRPDLPHISPFR
jgi:hypothetical protein